MSEATVEVIQLSSESSSYITFFRHTKAELGNAQRATLAAAGYAQDDTQREVGKMSSLFILNKYRRCCGTYEEDNIRTPHSDPQIMYCRMLKSSIYIAWCAGQLHSIYTVINYFITFCNSVQWGALKKKKSVTVPKG